MEIFLGRGGVCAHMNVQYNTAIKKEWSLSICGTMDRPGGYYAKWNKSVSQTEKDKY